MTVHAEILTDRQTKVLDAVAPIARARGFYLGGGTAVALRFGHRRSEDFDWFIDSLPEPKKVAEDLRVAEIALEAVEFAPGSLNCRASGVKVSFLQYPYPLLAEANDWSDKGVLISSVRDLAAMKLLAIAHRGSRKDFVDVHELLRQGLALSDMLADFRQKFSADSMTVLRGLVYFDDAEREPTPEMLTEFDWSASKRFFHDSVREIVR